MRRMPLRNRVAVGLILLSFVLLVPGLLRPLITLTASIEFMGTSQELFRETRSILQTIRNLHESGDDFVAGLILLFSVLVPFAKGLLLLVALPMRDRLRRWRIVAFVSKIGKWSMADVFLAGVYTAFLAAKATDAMDAELHQGFYWFAGYCLVSLVALQFLHVPRPEDSR